MTTRTVAVLPDGFTSPEYERPPVIETALTIQFDELTGIGSVHFGRFHELVREDFPNAEDQPRVNRIVEPFPLRERKLGVKLVGIAPLPRVWFEAAEGRDLLQLQPDRLSYNWRKVPDVPYPRYQTSARKFLRYLDLLIRFCADEGLPEIRPDLCEVVYVNHLRPERDETAIEVFFEAMGIKQARRASCLPDPEGANFNQAYPIGDGIGRLYAEAAMARAEEGEFVVLNLTARVKCAKGQDVEQALQLAHDWAVNGFASVIDRAFQKSRLGRTK